MKKFATLAEIRAHLDQLKADQQKAWDRSADEATKALAAFQRLERVGGTPNPALEKIANDAIVASENWRLSHGDLLDAWTSTRAKLETLAGPESD